MTCPTVRPDTLSSSKTWERKQFSYPNGVHVCEVRRVDPNTGMTEITGYTVVDDFGRIINPLIAGGQVMGGAVQGIGQALLEGVTYDETGQLLTGSFMDYCMPRAKDLPSDWTRIENEYLYYSSVAENLTFGAANRDEYSAILKTVKKSILFEVPQSGGSHPAPAEFGRFTVSKYRRHSGRSTAGCRIF